MEWARVTVINMTSVASVILMIVIKCYNDYVMNLTQKVDTSVTIRIHFFYHIFNWKETTIFLNSVVYTTKAESF